MAVTSPYLEAARDELWARDSFSFIPDRDLPEPLSTAAQGPGPRVAFAGFPSDYSLGFLYALLGLGVRLCGVITSPGAHPAILGHNALSRICDHLQMPLVRAWRVNDEHTRMEIEALEPDAVVMASFDQIVGARALHIPAHGWLNIHPSLLPEYRGPEPVYWAIADGAERTGITLHRAVPKFDAGPVLEQRSVPIAPTDTSGTLTRALVAAGVEALPAAVDKLLHDDPGVPPDMTRASYRPSVGHRLLEGTGSVYAAERMVRAGVPNMLAWSDSHGEPMYVLRARIADGGHAEAPVIHYPDGDLELTATSSTCQCHHDLGDCPHREP